MLRNNNTSTLRLAEASQFCRSNLGLTVSSEILDGLAEVHVLPVFRSGDDQYVLKSDLILFASALSRFCEDNAIGAHRTNLFGASIPSQLCLGHGDRVSLPQNGEKVDPAFFAALRNLLAFTGSTPAQAGTKASIYPYFSSMVTTSSEHLVAYIQQQQQRAEMTTPSRLSQFSGSAYYMGSKRHLSTFLVEAISSILPEHGTIIDLMCGSGAASGAFNRLWRTLASDAQEFSHILAVIQGGGFSASCAQDSLRQLLPAARDHADELASRLKSFLDWEEHIIHGSAGSDVLTEYQSFYDQLPSYPDGSACRGWDPVAEVDRRKVHPDMYPYCLFTAYFANVYFGLRQCIEIDSLRFAINKLETQKERTWALGALIATLSALGTTYAAHFAQPTLKPPQNISRETLQRILQRQAPSITHEFTVRLLSLAQESETSSREIEVLPGPWQNALTTARSKVNGEPVIVYVDAPYTRDEYSRYYHVLETLVAYNYPDAIGKGKLPSKSTGDRFRSEFFTKKHEQVNQAFVRLISEVLTCGWTCAWSYANSGIADMVSVIRSVDKVINCRVSSYAVPHAHKPQGGYRPKTVTEYLVMFVPTYGA
jgi:adenine-specific DNA methylase